MFSFSLFTLFSLSVIRANHIFPWAVAAQSVFLDHING